MVLPVPIQKSQCTHGKTHKGGECRDKRAESAVPRPLDGKGGYSEHAPNEPGERVGLRLTFQCVPYVRIEREESEGNCGGRSDVPDFDRKEVLHVFAFQKLFAYVLDVPPPRFPKLAWHHLEPRISSAGPNIYGFLSVKH